MSKVQSGKKSVEDSSNGKLLQEIEAISKALYLDKTHPISLIPSFSSQSKSVKKTKLPKPKLKLGNEDPSRKDKKSIWSWKALKAFTHVPNKRFNCCFSLHVHSIEGLPPNFNDLSLCVHWKRRDAVLMTHPARVLEGIAEFEEKLTYTCSVYGSRNGSHHSAKYEAKHFLLYASLFGNPELDLGKHRIDLTRLLPLTLEELEEENCSGKWTTSFRLSGEDKGASMNVSFGYLVVGDCSSGYMLKTGRECDQSNDRRRISRAESLPSRSHNSSRSLEDIKDLHEVLPVSRSELPDSVNMLYLKFEEENLKTSIDYKLELDVFSDLIEPVKPNSYSSGNEKENVESEWEVNELSAIEHVNELPSKEEVKSEEGTLKSSKIDSAVEVALDEDNELLSLVKEFGSPRYELLVNDCNPKNNDLCNKESLMKELEAALSNVSDLLKDGSDSREDETGVTNEEKYLEVKSKYKGSRKGKSLSMGDVYESVASDFLNMLELEHSPFGLSSESEPESPRERLLRQFEKDTLANGYSLFNFDFDEDPTEFDFDDPSVIQASEEIPKTATEAVRSKMKASTLEDLETEALMREWGLNEKAFQRSPSKSSCGSGNPIDLPPETPLELPPLGEGLGPFVQTSSGGFLRSMNPALYCDAKSKGCLIMQASSPVVLPAEMGSGIMEILQHLASVGIEKLSMQANKLMPLEDINGKTIQQIAWESSPSLEAPMRHVLLQHESNIGQKIKGKPCCPRSSKFESSSTSNEMVSEFVSLEDLAPLAMDKIESLSIEGLRIQSGMSNENATSNISPQSIGEFSALEGKRVSVGGSLGLDGAGGLQLMDIKDSGDDVDGLMGLSLTLDEWMKLDSGEIDDGDEISERTSKILAAHHASDLMRVRLKGEERRGKGARKYGLLGNNFTVALMVQLRDPLRNYEPVGAPMLALVQVEREFVPPKPKVYSTVSEIRISNEDRDESDPAEKEKKEEKKEEQRNEEEVIPQFKITEVHVAGFKTETGKKKHWGSKTQQQSGSRWLLANGMGKSNKHPFMKPKAAAKSSSSATTTVQPGDTLWSISSRVHGTGALNGRN